MNGKHAVVVGAGFGGMASAIRLRSLGYRVTVVEANDQAGGRAAVFHRDGYTFDAGPTVITAPYLFDELFEAVGRKAADYFELVPVDPFYRILYDDGSKFDYVGDEDRLLQQIRQFNPADVDGYTKLADHARRIFDIGYSQLAHTPFDRVSDMLRVVPDMVRLENYRSVYSLVSKYIRDERLRQAFTFQPLLVGGNPFNCSSIYLLIHWLERKWGVHFAKGGTTAIVAGMVRLLSEIGVDLQLSAPVEEIEVFNGQTRAVRIADGRRIPCDIVVANADPSMVYKHLIDARHRKKHTDRSVQRTKLSMGLFVAYFGTSRTYEDIAHHTIVLGPRYKGLLHDIFNEKRLAEDFSLYIHAPTRSDASMAPEGHEAFYVLSPVPNMRGKVDWEREGERYKEKIYASLEKRMLPGLRENMTVDFHVDPRYFRSTLRSMDGAAFGPEPRLTQSAWFRYHNRSEDVDGLYFVGSGTHPGAGVPGVLSSAKVLEYVLPKLSPGERVGLPSPAARRTAA